MYRQLSACQHHMCALICCCLCTVLPHECPKLWSVFFCGFRSKRSQSTCIVTPMTVKGAKMEPKGDKWSPVTRQRHPPGPPKVTNGAPMAVQRHPKQPKGPQRPPKTRQESPMKPKTQTIAIMASFRMQC